MNSSVSFVSQCSVAHLPDNHGQNKLKRLSQRLLLIVVYYMIVTQSVCEANSASISHSKLFTKTTQFSNSYRYWPIFRQSLRYYFLGGRFGHVDLGDSYGGQCPSLNRLHTAIAFSQGEYPFAYSKVVSRGDDDGGIYVVCLSTGAIRRITYGDDDCPRFSPDGKKIVYCHHSGLGAQIQIVDVGTKTVENLTQKNQVCIHPTWSPDGRAILFSVLDEKTPNTYLNIYKMPVSGGAGQLQLIARNADFAAYSSDGKFLSFEKVSVPIKTVPYPYSDVVICVESADGAMLHQVPVHNVIPGPIAWSPDGKRIAFVAHVAREAVAIYVCDCSGKHLTRVAPGPNPNVYANNDYWPAW